MVIHRLPNRFASGNSWWGLPAFIVQFVNIIGWLAARPIGQIKYSNFRDVAVPPDAQSYYANHGSPVFSEHGTIGEEPVAFLLWLILFLRTFAAFVWSRKQAAKMPM